MTSFRLCAALPFFLALAACSGRGERPEPGRTQRFDLVIDGQPVRLVPDRPEEGHIVGASIVGGRVINLAVLNKEHNLTFTISVEAPQGALLTPGSYQVYQCELAEGCDEIHDGRIKEATLGSYPGFRAAPGELKSAHKAPVLGLTPLTLTIASVKESYWPGVGPSRRVTGSFSGMLAYTERPRDEAPLIVGTVKKVEGSFDMYTILR